jgi:hypothetical protein
MSIRRASSRKNVALIARVIDGSIDRIIHPSNVALKATLRDCRLSSALIVDVETTFVSTLSMMSLRRCLSMSTRETEAINASAAGALRIGA